MIDLLFQIALSNAGISLVLAIVAVVVGVTLKRPALAHELAHVRRRDYLVRWIEWLACVCFWWNPVVWWARYNLRINEELCCEAQVVSSLKPKPHTYGDSLLKAVEILFYPAHRPPAMASEINSGRLLKSSRTAKRSPSPWKDGWVR